jgi:hypothetical protein
VLTERRKKSNRQTQSSDTMISQTEKQIEGKLARYKLSDEDKSKAELTGPQML